VEAISPVLLSFLREEGLAKSLNDGEVEFDAAIGGLYMLFLASEMARQQPIVSDNPAYEMLASSGLPSPHPEAAADRGVLLASAVFSSVIPVDIESVDIHDLIRFRNDHEDERTGFYDWMASYTADLSTIKDRAQLQEAVDHYGAAIAAKMSAFETKLSALKFKTATGIFSFSVPGILTGTWGLATTNPHLLLTGGALALLGLCRDYAVVLEKIPELRAALRFGGNEGLSLHLWSEICERANTLTAPEFILMVIEGLVLSRHFAVATRRYDGHVIRLRITIGEDGLVALVPRPWRPIPAQDKLASALSLMADCGLISRTNSGYASQ
jgi:hypothetical protein